MQKLTALANKYHLNVEVSQAFKEAAHKIHSLELELKQTRAIAHDQIQQARALAGSYKKELLTRGARDEINN